MTGRRAPDDRLRRSLAGARQGEGGGGGGGKSELRRAVRRLTAGRGDPKESGTEKIPPTAGRKACRARVKRCGKSAPRRWQHRWQAKPRTEQGQIGERYRWPAECSRVGCSI